MPRRNSLIVPLPEHSRTQRRNKSAYDRSSAFNTTPATSIPRQPYTLGASLSCPINLSSEEDEGEDDNDGTTPVTRARPIVKIRNEASKPRPSSARQPRSQQPTTPDRDRPQPHREPVSDPGPHPRIMQEAFQDRVIAYQQENRLPCGRKEYASPEGKWSEKHRSGCQKCQDQQSDQRRTEASEDEGVSMLRWRTTLDLHRSDHDGNNLNNSNNNDDKNENEQEAAGVVENQNASILHHRLIQTAKEKLTSDEKAGYLYILRNPENPGLLKLGCSMNIWKRGKQHKARCGLMMSWVHISNCVENMKRAEKLAKLDMDHLRKDWKCSSCSQTHKEWFQVDEEKAKRVTRKWIEWINEQKPYKSSGELEPMWGWLMDFGRVPRHDFAENDHEARWAHWDHVLPPPSRTDLKKFNGREMLKSVDRHSDSKATPTTYLQPTSKDQQNVLVRQPLTIAEQASSKALETKQNGNTFNIISNLNVNRDYLGSASRFCSTRR